MTHEKCFTCRKPNAILNCENCHESLCRGCVEYLDPAQFSFYQTIPPELSHDRYCGPCYDGTVVPAFEVYQEVLERAKDLHFFFDTRCKPVPTLRKSKDKVSVTACSDRDETILRLGFLAAEQGYNAVVEAEVICKKVRNEGYQKSVWSGTGVPAEINSEKFDRAVSGKYS